MSTEYVRITPSEHVYGEANLLQSEISLLTMTQQYQEYEILRKEELLLKVELKKKISELKEFLDTLAKSLPESKFEEEEEMKEKARLEMIEKIESSVEKSRKSEWLHWKESPQKMPKFKPERLPPKKKEKPKEIPQEEPKKTPIETELEAIKKRLAKLQ